ncbi:MAG TPA: hypothetical protein VNR38_18190 [Ureibacillus sp.]|nr:hypothetical protein [Ureibacillus sp.]
MKKEEKLNEEAAMNNNLGSATIQMNQEIAKEHVKPKIEANSEKKKPNTKLN